MSSVRTFFLREGAECLSGIREEVGKPTMDAAAVYRAIRRFRGSAQMAGFGALAERALTLEERLRRARDEVRTAARDGVPNGARDEIPQGAVGDTAPGTTWEMESLRPEVRAVLESLEKDVEAVREGRLEGDPRTEAGMEEQDRGAEAVGRAGAKGVGEAGGKGGSTGGGKGAATGVGAASGGAGVVSLDEIEYRGEAALDRALQLRPALEDAIVSDRPAGPILDELFDLLRLGLK